MVLLRLLLNNMQRGAASVLRAGTGLNRGVQQSTAFEGFLLRNIRIGNLNETGIVGTGAKPFSTKARLHMEETQKVARRKAVENASYLTALVIGMVGLTYASVPLYRMFCQATGYGGTTQRLQTLEEKLSQPADPLVEENLRELKIHFNADVTSGMNWKFTPTQRSVRTTPGESTLAFYTVKNLSDKPITGVSTYNVTPQKAGLYFNKVQCFCFEEQRLRPGEEIDMPVFFYIDREFATDPNMRDIESLTLSYTFFKVNEE